MSLFKIDDVFLKETNTFLWHITKSQVVMIENVLMLTSPQVYTQTLI